MKFISKWSYACAKSLAEAMNENHQQRFVYYFAAQLIIGELVKTLILFGLSLILGIFTPTLIITVTFVSLRLLAGGYHMNTQGKCLYATLGLFLSAAIIARHTYQYWGSVQIAVLIVFTFLTGIYILGRYAPRDNPHNPITDLDKIRKLKTLSFVHLITWLTVAGWATVCDLRLIPISMCFGVLLELFIVSNLGHKIFGKLNDSFK